MLIDAAFETSSLTKYFDALPTAPTIALLVLLIERLVTIPDSYHPIVIFRFIALRLGEKITKRQQSSKQQDLSGLLSIIVLLFPTLTLVALLLVLTELPWLFEAVMFFFCISWQPMRKTGVNVVIALTKKRKSVARELLKPWVLRETSNLTEFGISKACIEALVYRCCKQTFGVLIYFLLLGGLGALSYRLVIELSQVWNKKQPTYHHFGNAISSLATWLDIIPMALFSMLLAALRNIKTSLFYIKQLGASWRPAGSRWLISVASASLGVQLGGPAMYGEQKLRRPKIGKEKATSEHIKLTISVLDQLLVTVQLVLLMAIAFYLALLFTM